MSADAPTGSVLSHLLANPDDAGARDRFVAYYGPQIRKWCRALCRQQADADDLYQSVWCKLLQQMAIFRYDPRRGRFRGWLKTVARNTWLNMVKSARPGKASGLVFTEEARTDWERMIEEIGERELFGEAVARVRPRLNDGTWEAFQRNALEGQPAREVARSLGTTVAAVYMLKARVIRMLKKEIASLDGGETSP